MADNYNNEILGDGSFFWWTGRVADDDTWRENQLDKLRPDPARPGWGQRVKVRIFRNDPADKSVLPDDVLKMADIANSPNAGSGAGGAKASHNIRQGDLVWGFFKDGIDQNEPVLVGVLAHGSQTELYPGDPPPPQGFLARTDYKGRSGDKTVHRKDQVGGSGKPREQNDDPNQTPNANYDKEVDDSRKTPVKSNCEKDNPEVKGIQMVIQNLLTLTQYAKKASQSASGSQGFSAAGAPNFIDSEIKKASKIVAGFLKDVLAKGRGAAVKEINKTLEQITPALFPNQRDDAKKGIEKATDTLTCVFNKIIAGLISLVESLLKDLVNKYVTGPICAIENFLGQVIENVLGQITDAIDSVFQTLSSLFGGALEGISGALDIVSSVLGIASSILEFFSCDEDKNCPTYDGWTFGAGAQTLPSISDGFGKKLQGIVNGLGDGGGSQGQCNTSGFPCGPPTVEFYGGGGSGASGNAVVSVTGAILGIDITNPGQGYSSPPTVSIGDGCGNGSGSVAKAIIGPLTGILFDGTNGDSLVQGDAGYTPPIGITDVEMVDVGLNYLPAPDGSVGGGGVTIANPGDAVYTDPDGNLEYYDSGATVPVQEGGSIGLSPGVEAQIYDDDGNLVQEIVGQGLLNPVTVEFDTLQPFGVYEYIGEGGAGSQNLPPSQNPDEWLYLGSTGVGGDGVPAGAGTDTGATGTGAGTVGGGTGTTGTTGTVGGTGGVGTGTQIAIFDDADLNKWDPDAIYYNGSVIKYNSNPLTGSFTVPGAPDPDTLTVIDSGSELTSGNKYPVVLSLKSIVIVNPGYSYSPDDQIFITPNNGANLSVEYDQFGKVTKVNVINPGLGFTDVPEIGIISLTGYNATFRPIFDIRRLSEEDFETLPQGTDIISVVDCVGKF